MRVLNCHKQPAQPFPQQEEEDYRKAEEELVKFDVDYLIKCLGMERKASYRIKRRPDIQSRQSPQPDYLIENCKTGSLVTVEHARFFESEEAREKTANLVKKSKLDIVIQGINFPTAEQLGQRLSEFVSEKLGKGQFKNFSHTERILLARNRWGGVRIHRFIKAEPYFKLQEPVECDHFFLIVDGRLLKVF
jgi:hypothetical protein